MSILRWLAPMDFINSKRPRFVQHRTNDGMRRWQRALSHGRVSFWKSWNFFIVRHRIEGSGSSLTNPSSSLFSRLSFSPFHTSLALGAPSSCPPLSRTRRCRHRQMLLSRRAAIINTEANVLLENAIVRLIQFARNVSGPLQRAHRGKGAKRLCPSSLETFLERNETWIAF